MSKAYATTQLTIQCTQKTIDNKVYIKYVHFEDFEKIAVLTHGQKQQRKITVYIRNIKIQTDFKTKLITVMNDLSVYVT